MIDKVRQTILKNNLIDKGDHIIVGVSGGPDSVCLLNVLYELKAEFDIKMSVVHINHMLRGEASDGDQRFVEDLCQSMKIDCFVYSRDINLLSKQLKLSSEEAGRKVRYEAFYEVRDKQGAQKIAIAQNLNDQAETILMRLMRGTGPDGLAGIDYIREGHIIRPLLDVSRSEIEAYCKEKNLTPRIDHTNLEPIYTRNKIRLELIPYIKENFNENIIENLGRMARIIKEDKEYIYSAVEDIMKCHAVREGEHISIPKGVFTIQERSIKKRIIIKAFSEIGLSKDITSTHLDKALNIIEENNTSSSIDFPSGFWMKIGYDDIFFSKKPIDRKEDFCYEMIPDKEINICQLNSKIFGYIISRDKIQDISDLLYTKYFDFHKINGKIRIRNRKKGDTFAPLGMKGTKKLKDFFIDEKIPRELRDSIPLLCCGSDVLWIIGHRISERYKIDSNTKEIFVVEYHLPDIQQNNV